MNKRALVAVSVLSCLLLGTALSLALPPQSADREKTLKERLEKADNPVKKAKIEVRLAEIKLSQAFDAYDRGKFDLCWSYMDEYLAGMNSAWKDLQDSGRDASRKPDGFKELEIGLRKSRRSLEDFETRVTYEERQEVEKVRKASEDLRSHVLNVLFPEVVPGKKKKDVTREFRIARTAAWEAK